MKTWKSYKRDLALVAVVVVVAVGLVIINLPRNSTEQVTKPSVGQLLGMGSRGSAANVSSAALTDAQIETYQQKLKKSEDTISFGRLGLAYLQKAREVGDPVYYSKAEAVLKRALELDPNNFEALDGLGSLALSRHQFSQALEWGEKAHKLKPNQSYNYGIIADAQIELGRYEEAAQTIQQMVDLRPDISSYSRVSYIRELYGQYDSAVEAMQMAVRAVGATPENTAWVLYQLGNLYFSRNKLSEAEQSYRQALAGFPNYVYAQAGLARLMAARGDLNGATELYADVTRRMPLPEFLIELGDLYTLADKPTEANRQYELVRQINKIYRENGVVTDLEMALFNADHALSLPETLSQLREQYKLRPDVKAADALAWTLYQTGDYKAALEYSEVALRLSQQNSLFLYHQGLILAKLNRPAEAQAALGKALSLNPNFSFRHAAEAQKILANL